MSSKTENVSKANMLFLMEKSNSLKDESLEDIKTTMEKEMDSKDWVEFAAILKKGGMKHSEICSRVKKSESWIKKYVNPILNRVTPLIKFQPPSDTNNRLKPGLPIHTVLKFTISELKKETRTFGGWGSVEVLDSQEEVVSIEGLEAIMPTYMKRGAPIMFGHSNRHVGNVFKYKIKDKVVKGKNIPALWLEGRIHSDYKIDDMAWDALQYAYAAGLPVLSLGATPIGHPEVQCNDKLCFKKYNEFQLYEFTITEQQKGSIGANPESTIEVALAKSKEEKQLDSATEKEFNKRLSELEKSDALPKTDIELVNIMLATCGSCQDEYQNMIKQGKTEEQAKATLLKEMVETLNSTKSTEKENPDNSGNPDEIIKSAIAKETAGLAAVLTKIDARMDKFEETLTKMTSQIGSTNAGFLPGATVIKQEDEEEDEETDGEIKPPPVEKAETDEAPAQMTFSADFEKQMEQYLKKKGFTKVAETPIPATTAGREIAEIQKGAANVPGNKSKSPSSAEMSDALANWKYGGLEKLAKEYSH